MLYNVLYNVLYSVLYNVLYNIFDYIQLRSIIFNYIQCINWQIAIQAKSQSTSHTGARAFWREKSKKEKNKIK